MESAVGGSQDVLTEGLRIEGASVVLNVDIGLDGARVEGVVRDGQDNLVPDSPVLLIPAPSRRGPVTQFPAAMADSRGSFVIEAVPAGEYSILALDDAALPLLDSSFDFFPLPSLFDLSYQRREFLEQFGRFAEPITVEPGLGEVVTVRAVRLTN